MQAFLWFVNKNTTLSHDNETPEIRFSQSEPVLNFRDPLLFPTDESEDSEVGVRPPKASIAKAQLQPRDRRTAGPAGWGNFRELNAALDAHAARVGWKAAAKETRTNWIRNQDYVKIAPHHGADLDRAA